MCSAMTNLSMSAFLNLSHSGYTIISEQVIICEDFIYVWSCTYICTVEIRLPEHWLSRLPIIHGGLALWVNLSRIPQNQLALKLPVIGSRIVQCYSIENFKSGCKVRHRYKLETEKVEIQTAIEACFQRKIQLSRKSVYPDGLPSQLIQISGVLLCYKSDKDLIQIV